MYGLSFNPEGDEFSKPSLAYLLCTVKFITKVARDLMCG